MPILEVKEIETIDSSTQDDLLICCASFEPRCKGVVRKLSPNYRVTCSIIFWYNEPDLTCLRVNNVNEMKKDLEKHSSHVEVVEVPRDDPIEGIKNLREKCLKKGYSISGRRITLDITTFTKQYTLVLLRLLGDYEKDNFLRVLYTEPLEYGPKKGGTLTAGLKKIVSVPFFGGRYRIGKRSLLILFLGYEEERAIAVWEEYEPDKTIAFIGKPGYHEGWERVSEEINKRLFTMPKVERRTIATLDPIAVANELEKIRNDYSDWNLYISPLGSKVQALGIYLFIRKRPEVQVVYALPLSYLEGDYSHGIGTTWQFYLKPSHQDGGIKTDGKSLNDI